MLTDLDEDELAHLEACDRKRRIQSGQSEREFNETGIRRENETNEGENHE